ncbi:MAG: DMT family transporter [Patescibacteria group bacterium]|nr:DMT family transporter [Patescibacteria group bacterium]
MKKAIWAGICFSLLYSLFVVIQQKFVRTSLHPVQINAFSNAFALILVLLFARVFSPHEFKVKHKKGLKYALVSGLFAAVFADLFVLYGLQISSATNASILLKLTIILTFAFSMIAFKQKITKYKILSIFIALAGTVLIVFDFEHGYTINLGDLLFLGAVLSYSLANIANQKASKYLSTIQILIFRSLSATVILIPISLLFFPIATFPSIGLITFNGIVIATGCFLVTTIIRNSNASFFEIISSLIPVFTIILSYFFFKDLPTAYQIIGGLLIIGSIPIFLK